MAFLNAVLMHLGLHFSAIWFKVRSTLMSKELSDIENFVINSGILLNLV